MITNKQTTHKPTSGLASILPSLEVNTAPAATPSTTSSYRIRREPPLSNRERASEVMLRFGPPPSATTTSGDLGLEEFTQREIDQSKYWFKHGDTYAPNDLTMEELRTRRLRGRRPVRDAFDVLGLNPLSQYKNYNLLSEYVTSMGRIMHSKDTGLRPVNQRRIAKAIRRAVGIGLIPSVHKHPEILKNMEINFAQKMNMRR